MCVCEGTHSWESKVIRAECNESRMLLGFHFTVSSCSAVRAVGVNLFVSELA